MLIMEIYVLSKSHSVEGIPADKNGYICEQ